MSNTNTGSESTTWEYRKVKMSRRRRPDQDSAPKGHRWRRFRARDPREPITITLKYRGGPEAWVEVRGRGETNRYPGWVALYDLVRDINQMDKG